VQKFKKSPVPKGSSVAALTSKRKEKKEFHNMSVMTVIDV
jgi:hypothetical protein